MNKKKISLKNRLWFAFLLPLLVFTLLLYASIRLEIEPLFAIPLAFIFSLTITAFAVNYFYRPFASLIESIETGLNCFHDEDFSINIAEYDFEEFDFSVETYNQLSKILRDERMELYQRELLLDTIIQNTPMAIVLTSSKDEIIYSNVAAKNLFKQHQKIEGKPFSALVDNLPKDLATATKNRTPGLYNNNDGQDKEVFYLILEEFNLNAQLHHLYLYKNMTQEVHKEEVLVWKKVIRLISHELNNSLAPIQSLSRSAQKRIAQTTEDELLTDIFETIQRRALHLHHFIDKYAKFSRLPIPELKLVDLEQFIGDIETICQVNIDTNARECKLHFDPAQVEQVLINLLKNARESGSKEEEITLSINKDVTGLEFVVEDRGIGMSDEQLNQSVLPFYTTKPNGTGLGLALCKEIINAHQGQLKMFNRKSGGLTVAFSLPIK